MAAMKVDARTIESEIRKELSHMDQELGYQRTLRRMQHAGSVTGPVRNAINVHTQGPYSHLATEERSVY